jgi:hypothetical protein
MAQTGTGKKNTHIRVELYSVLEIEIWKCERRICHQKNEKNVFIKKKSRYRRAGAKGGGIAPVHS